MAPTTPRIATKDVARARAIAADWAARSDANADDALGASWLALQKEPFLHCRPSSQQDEQIAKHMGTDLEEVPGDVAEDMHPHIHPDDTIMDQQFIERVHALLRTLPPRTERLLRLRFGLGREEPMSLDEVGSAPGAMICRERANQILAKGLRFLKHPNRSLALHAVATGDVGRLIESALDKWTAEFYARWRREREEREFREGRRALQRKAEAAIMPEALMRYREQFGQDWFLRPTSELLAANGNEHRTRAA